MKKTNSSSTAIKTIFGIAAIVFISAAVMLGAISALNLDLRSPPFVFLASLLLAAAIAPSVYWLVCADTEHAPSSTEDMNASTVTDQLTHVMNSRGITMGVLEAMAQAERYGTPLSVAMVDVDHLQNINDDHGQSTGDKALANIAGVLAETLRMPDKVGRYEGEEFMLVFPHTGISQARKIAERVRVAVNKEKMSVNGKRVDLSVSIGVAQYAKGKDLEYLLSRANAAVEQAKRAGGNRVVAQKSAAR